MKNSIGVRCVVAMAWLTLVASAADSARPPQAIAADGQAMVREWKPPVYPPDALKEKASARVTTRIIVDETGAVTSARVLQTTDQRFGDAAVAAVKLWKFTPAIKNQKPVAMSLDVPFNFDGQKGAKSWKAGLLPDPAWMPRLVPPTDAVARSAPAGGYPPALTERRLSGEALFSCTVQADGRPTNLQIIAATHADFVLPGFAAIQKWEFTPAQQGDLTFGSELHGKVTFDSIATTRAEVLAANGITAPDGTAPVNQPLPRVVSDPVWPHAALLKGEGGSATVEFIAEPDGRVTHVKVREASRPEFGSAAAAALEEWIFDPAMAGDHTIAVPLVKHTEFKPVPLEGDEPVNDPVARLVRLERAGAIRGGSGLDDKITPLYRPAPMYPAALRDAKPAGQAVIEFVIDRDGRARLAHALSATQEEFGWAAATSVSEWVFKVPMRGGKPTEVKVQIPVNFSLPAN